MRKIIGLMVVVLALVFSVSGIAVAGGCYTGNVCEKYEPVEFSDPMAPPPKGYKTVKTPLKDGDIQVGGVIWKVFFWGSPECPLDKEPGVQRWTRETWLPCSYKIMLSSEKAARDCRFNRTEILREFLEAQRHELDRRPLQPASVGYQAYITLQPKKLRDAGLDP